MKASIAQIEKVEKDVNSFVTLDKEGALKRAEEVQKLIDDGTLTGPLAGVPVAIKDSFLAPKATIAKPAILNVTNSLLFISNYFVFKYLSYSQAVRSMAPTPKFA